MTDPEDLDHELRLAHSGLRPCCGLVYMRYEPGCTYATCSECGRKVSHPDWDPRGVAEEWNALLPMRKIDCQEPPGEHP